MILRIVYTNSWATFLALVLRLYDVRLSVCLVGGYKSIHDSIGRCLGYLLAEADPCDDCEI